MKVWFVVSAAVFVSTLAAASPAARAEDTRPLSPAQIALFESHHLDAIRHPAKIEYQFKHEAGADTYTDKVSLDVEPRADGKKDVSVDFLSGDHHMPFPPALGFNGNPVLMYFLERDVTEMHRVTGGAATYFRNRIRQAFVDRAETHPTSVTVDGKEQKGTEITLAPFRDDPLIARFADFKDKTYRFVLSDAVPGEIVEIGTVVPGADGAAPRVAETMTFAGEHE
jgi:hypothetical protein